MKKLFLFFALLLFAVGLNAQTSGTTYVLAPGVTSKTAFNYVRSTAYTATQLKDTVSGTAVKYWIFDIAKSNLYYFQTVVVFDTTCYRPAGRTAIRTLGNHVTVWLYGSIDGSYWSPIDSLIFHPTRNSLPAGANGIVQAVQMKDLATGVLWRYMKVEATGADAGKASLISKLMVKVGLKY